MIMIAIMDMLPATDSSRTDREHLKLLAIFHLVVAGIAVVLFAVVLAQRFAFSDMSRIHEMLLEKQAAPKADEVLASEPSLRLPPAGIFDSFLRFFWIWSAAVITGAVLNLVSGLCLLRQRFRTLSLIVAGLDCVWVPFGTVLGVFTIIVLMRESVTRLYDTERSS